MPATLPFAFDIRPLLAGVAAIIFYLTANRLLRWYRRRELIRRHGCEPIVIPAPEQITPMEKAFLGGRFNEETSAVYRLCGSLTYMDVKMDETLIHSADPVIAHHIVTKMDEWIKEPRPTTLKFNGDNIIQQNGRQWRHTRSLVDPLFKRAELNDTENFKVFVDRLIERIPRDGSTIDLQPLIRKLYIDSATDFIFGQSLDSLRDETGKSGEFIAAYDRAQIGAGKRARNMGWYSQLKFMLQPDKAWRADYTKVHQFVDECIARSRNTNNGSSEKRKRYILIDGMSKEIQDPIALRFQLLGIFSLARETPAVLASNVLFLLARHPDIWTELREQALAIKSDEELNFEKLMNMTLFRHVIQETIRLHTPLPRTRRMAARDCVLPRGGGPDGSAPAFIPKGQFVWCNKYPKSRDPAIWGDDVDAFRPSRFEDRKLGLEFSPFSSGPRICPANRQVISQCIYLLYRLVREFESIENRDPVHEYVEGVMMCLYGKNGTQIALRPASA